MFARIFNFIFVGIFPLLNVFAVLRRRTTDTRNISVIKTSFCFLPRTTDKNTSLLDGVDWLKKVRLVTSPPMFLAAEKREGKTHNMWIIAFLLEFSSMKFTFCQQHIQEVIHSESCDRSIQNS